MNNLDYKYLRAWCSMMGSREYYLQEQLEKARRDKAPQDVVYSINSCWEPKGWRRFSEVSSWQTKMVVENIMKERGYGMQKI